MTTPLTTITPDTPRNTPVDVELVRDAYAYTMRHMEAAHGPAVRAIVTDTKDWRTPEGGVRSVLFGHEFNVEFDDGTVCWLTRPGGFDHSGTYSDFRDGRAWALARIEEAHTS